MCLYGAEGRCHHERILSLSPLSPHITRSILSLHVYTCCTTHIKSDHVRTCNYYYVYYSHTPSTLFFIALPPPLPPNQFRERERERERESAALVSRKREAITGRHQEEECISHCCGGGVVRRGSCAGGGRGVCRRVEEYQRQVRRL